MKKVIYNGYVQCDIEAPDSLRAQNADFLSISQNISIGWTDLHLVTLPKKTDFCLNFGKMLSSRSSFTFQIGLLITLLRYLF